jgi:hypothetical protein
MRSSTLLGWTLLGVTCGALALPQVSRAQSRADDYAGVEGRRWEFTLGGSGGSDRNLDSGSFGGTTQIGYFFNDNIEGVLRQSVDFAKGSEDSRSNTVAATRLALDYHFDLGRIAPFVGVNFGGLYGDGVEEQFVAGPEAGFKIFLRPQTFLFLLGEYQVLFENSDRFDDNFDEGRWGYTFGLGFNW